MGNCGSAPAEEDSAAVKRSRAIDKNLEEDAKTMRKECKLLLLGSGESGKSTVVKQMKIIHQGGYSEDERKQYKLTVYKNVVDCAKALIAAMKQFDIAAEGDGTDEACKYIETYEVDSDPSRDLDPKLGETVTILWKDAAVQKVLSRQNEFYLMDSASYFFDEVKRIAAPGYIPDTQDVLRARTKTTGIYETRFSIGELSIHMFDVGGQRSERKKWIHCFEHVTSIIFCVAMSEYDQVLLEETTQNRMQESLNLFESIVNSRWFIRTSIILFMNKMDLFQEKLPKSPFEAYFPDYTGGPDPQKAAKYMLWRFNQLNRANLSLYPHLTQATDTTNIRLVFAAVKETILQNALRDAGIL